MAVHNVMISCSHEAVIESGYVEVAPHAPFVRGDVPDARVEEYQRAVPVGEATDHPRASPDLPIKHVHHAVHANPLAALRGIFHQKDGEWSCQCPHEAFAAVSSLPDLIPWLRSGTG